MDYMNNMDGCQRERRHDAADGLITTACIKVVSMWYMFCNYNANRREWLEHILCIYVRVYCALCNDADELAVLCNWYGRFFFCPNAQDLITLSIGQVAGNKNIPWAAITSLNYSWFIMSASTYLWLGAPICNVLYCMFL